MEVYAWVIVNKSTLLNKLKQSFFVRGQLKLKGALKLKLLLADL